MLLENDAANLGNSGEAKFTSMGPVQTPHNDKKKFGKIKHKEDGYKINLDDNRLL